jgi:hypothetical protein
MDQDRANFRAWYTDALELLYPRRDAGIAVFMIALLLLERYLRRANGRAADDELNAGCWRTLRALFPTLTSDQTADDFWTACRQGFVHQASMSLRAKGARSSPPVSLTHDIVIDPVTVNADGSFVIHPVLFSKWVVRTIEQDFAVFAGSATPAVAMPKIVATAPPADGIIVPSITPKMRGGS